MSTLQNSNVSTNATCCDGVEEHLLPGVEVHVVGALTVFGVLVFGFCFLIVGLVVCKNLTLAEEAVEAAREATASHERKQERRRKRREFVSNGLIVKEWAPVEPQVESTATEDQDTPQYGETAEAPQPPVPPINSSLTACSMGSEDCESLDGDEEMAGCSICLSHFKPQQLVCESYNSSCQHVFHKDCMVDWLMKYHDNCPMCREVYLLKTV
jgi:hypothetical protein